MVLRIYYLQYSTWTLETCLYHYFPLFLFKHVLVQVFMKLLIQNLSKNKICVKNVAENVEYQQLKKKGCLVQEMLGEQNRNFLETYGAREG